VVENSRSCGYGHDQRAHLLLADGIELRTEGDELHVLNQARYSRDAAEIQPRCSRDTAEMQPRYSRDTAEI